jgi:hypothetical protein
MRIFPKSPALVYSKCPLGQGNGNLQIHFMDVGQGDGAILISPQGETVLFDDGRDGSCDKPVSYCRAEALFASPIDGEVRS